MTQISRVGGGTGPARTGAATRAGAGGPAFAVETGAAAGPEAANAAETAPVLGALALSEVLALQEQAGGVAPRGGDAEAHRDGRDLLDALVALQRDLLGSGEGAGALGRLASLLERPPQSDDPVLGPALREVVLRARIEVARRQQG